MRSLIRPLMKRRRGTCSARSEFCFSCGILAFGFKPNLAQAISLLFASEWCFIVCCQIVSKKNGVPFGLGLKPKKFLMLVLLGMPTTICNCMCRKMCVQHWLCSSVPKILTRPAHPGHRSSRARRGGCNSLRAIGTPIGLVCTGASPLKGA